MPAGQSPCPAETEAHPPYDQKETANSFKKKGSPAGHPEMVQLMTKSPNEEILVFRVGPAAFRLEPTKRFRLDHSGSPVSVILRRGEEIGPNERPRRKQRGIVVSPGPSFRA